MFLYNVERENFYSPDLGLFKKQNVLGVNITTRMQTESIIKCVYFYLHHHNKYEREILCVVQ